MSPRLILTHHSNVVATVVVMKQQQLHYTQETHINHIVILKSLKLNMRIS